MDWKLLVLCVMCILVIGGCIYTVIVETKSYQKGLNNKEKIDKQMWEYLGGKKK